jgi:hypothetical protein
MTYIARAVAPFKVDILAGSDPSSFTVGAQIPCTGTPQNTGVTVSSGALTLYAGSSWRIEYSAAFAGNLTTGNGEYTLQFYSTTDSAYVGQKMWATSPGYNNARKGRVTCTALILDSDISTSKTIEVRIISLNQMQSGTAYAFLGNANFRILELPS